jgi:hypothetical protein
VKVVFVQSYCTVHLRKVCFNLNPSPSLFYELQQRSAIAREAFSAHPAVAIGGRKRCVNSVDARLRH